MMLQTLDGRSLPWSQFDGQVRLVVNTASACGFTPQLAGLQALLAQAATQAAQTAPLAQAGLHA